MMSAHILDKLCSVSRFVFYRDGVGGLLSFYMLRKTRVCREDLWLIYTRTEILR